MKTPETSTGILIAAIGIYLSFTMAATSARAEGDDGGITAQPVLGPADMGTTQGPTLTPSDTTSASGGVHPNFVIVPPNAVAAFYSSDDHKGHAIIATQANQVKEVFFTPATPSSFGSSVLATFGSSIVGVGGFFSTWDNVRHAIVALSNNQIWEVWYSPSAGVHTSLLLTAGGSITRIASYYSTGDGFAHVVYAVGGFIFQYRYNPYCSSGCGTNYGLISIGNMPSLSLLTAFYGDDSSEHVIAGTNSGTTGIGGVVLKEWYYFGSGGISSSTLAGTSGSYPAVAIAGVDVGPGWTSNAGVPFRYDVELANHDATPPAGFCAYFIEEYQYVPNPTGSDTLNPNPCPSS